MAYVTTEYLDKVIDVMHNGFNELQNTIETQEQKIELLEKQILMLQEMCEILKSIIVPE